MTASDKKDILVMFNDFKEHNNEVRGLENKAILKELSEIKKLQEYANGTQKRHTEQIGALERNLPHTVEGCAQKDTIQLLLDSYKAANSVKKWKVAALVIGSSFLGAIVAVIGVFEFIMKYKP